MKKLILIALSLLVVPAAFAAGAAAGAEGQQAPAANKAADVKEKAAAAQQAEGSFDSIKKQYNNSVDAVYQRYTRHTFLFPAALVAVGMFLAKPVTALYYKLFKSEEAVEEETLAQKQRRSAATAQAKSDALLAQRLAAEEFAAERRLNKKSK
jgi:hypothetical protein